MKSKNKQPMSSYGRAQKRVKEIKGFYGHLAVYLVVNVVLLFTRNNFKFILVSDSTFEDVNFLTWINWETYGTPIFWGIGLAINAICVFGKNPFLGKAWEERQMRKYIKEDTQQIEKY